MNSRLFIIALICFSSCIFFRLSAEEQQLKIGYIDLEYVFANSVIRDTLYKDYLAQKERILQARKTAEASLILLRKEIRDSENLLGFEEYRDAYQKAEIKVNELEKTIMVAREELKKWESDGMAAVFDEIHLILEIISKEENMPIILSKHNSVMHGNSNLDMSQRAIDLINEFDERNTPSAK